MRPVYELDVYKLAEELSDLIWYAYDHWPQKVQMSIGYQVLRSADSIAANLAEGFGRYTFADRKLFYRYARGSFEETKAWLRKLIRRRVILSEKDISQYAEIIDILGPRLNAFILIQLSFYWNRDQEPLNQQSLSEKYKIGSVYQEHEMSGPIEMPFLPISNF